MDTDTRIIVGEAVRIVEAAGPGAAFSTARLARLAAERACSQIDVNGLDLFDIDYEIRERLEDAGMVLDSLHHFGRIEGVPYCLDFIVRRRPPKGHAWAPNTLDGLESLFFSIGGFHQGRHEVAVVRDGGRWRSVIDSWGAGRMSIGAGRTGSRGAHGHRGGFRGIRSLFPKQLRGLFHVLYCVHAEGAVGLAGSAGYAVAGGAFYGSADAHAGKASPATHGCERLSLLDLDLFLLGDKHLYVL